jgi:hypothetical protein
MHEEIINFLNNVKNKIKTGNYKIIGEKKNEYELMEMINRYITYLWYKQTNDNNFSKYDELYIPKDIKNINFFCNINFLDISEILAYIKYYLIKDIDDILLEKTLNRKYLKDFSLNKLKKFSNHNCNSKEEHINYILKNKVKLFTIYKNKEKKLKKIKVVELYEMCKEKGFTTNYKRLKKQEYIECILNNKALRQKKTKEEKQREKDKKCLLKLQDKYGKHWIMDSIDHTRYW